MRYIIMHKTDAHWEGGALPTQALIARVGALLGEMSKAGRFLAGEGLRPSAEGVRVRLSPGQPPMITKGPFEAGNELPAGFSIVRVGSLDDAVAWASEQAGITGDLELDIRPVTEPWDIGLGRKPERVTTRRYMVLRKATRETEADIAQSAEQRAKLARFVHDAGQRGVHLATETMRSSTRGRRYKNSKDGISFFDGPFVESKELIGGYVIISAPSLEEAHRWAMRYLDTVESDEVDVRELE